MMPTKVDSGLRITTYFFFPNNGSCIFNTCLLFTVFFEDLN